MTITNVLSFVFFAGLAFILQELPSSNVLQSTLPNWPLLLVVYLSLSHHMVPAVSLSFILGLTQDVFMGMPLGLNAMGFTLCSFFIIRARHKDPVIGALKQSFLVMWSALFVVALNLAYSSILFTPAKHYWALLSVPSSFIAWSLIHVLLPPLKRWGQR